MSAPSPTFRSIAAVALACLAAATAPAAAPGFDGWEGMRVIALDGRAERLLVADLGNDGRDDVVVVNPRQARLDVYRWLPPAERTRADAVDPARPNELPLAPDFSHGEIPIDELPVDALAHDLDGDKRPELLVLTTPSNKIAIYAQAPDLSPDARGAWKKTGERPLLAGTPTGRTCALLVRDVPGGRHELLASFEQGIQQLPLEPGGRASWLSPRESRGRIDWQLADADGDGDDDLLEWSSVARQSVRWYPCDADGALLPAQTLHEQPIEGFRAGRPPAAAGGPRPRADLLLLGGSDKGVLRRHQLVRGAASDVGRQDALPMPGAARRGWCGVMLPDAAGAAAPAIVSVDPAQPRLRVQRLSAAGWQKEESFPAVGGIRGLAAPAAVPGLVLVWTKDAADLHRCRFENGRLTYPQPWAAEGKDRKILALDAVGATVWWAQRVGPDLDLFVWPPEAAEPRRTRFAGLGPKVEQVVWLGGETLIVQDAFAPAGRLVALADGKPVIATPPLLAKFDPAEYQAVAVDGGIRKARLTDGVLQWLGDDLHPVDQVMLGEGQKIAAYLPAGPGEAWALEQGGGFLHRLRADAAGVMRVAESVRPPTATGLRGDPVLGLVLVDQERIVRLARGEPWELKLVESVDGRIGRRSGVSESTIHRVLVSDIDGDGGDDVALCDDRRHELTALLRRPEALERSVSWKVFDDRKYPYDGGESRDLEPEPRRIAGLDADGDDARDLVLVSQDRLLVYLGKDAAR
jgi:hypothetical protein